MTSPLVNPDGYSTLSRLDSSSSCPSTSTVTAVRLRHRRRTRGDQADFLAFGLRRSPTSGAACGPSWPPRRWPRARPSGRRSSASRPPPRAPRTPRRPPSSRSGRAPARGSRRGTCRVRTRRSATRRAPRPSCTSRAETSTSSRPASSSIESGQHDLVGVGQRRHHQPPVDGPDRRRVLLVAHHEAADGDLAGLLHRPGQQHVRLRVGVGRDVVGALEVDRVDLARARRTPRARPCCVAAGMNGSSSSGSTST